MQRSPPLRALIIFEVAARHESFQLAAHELSLTPSAVSHQIKALEEHLGRALFVRMNRKVRLTPAGQSYCHFVREALRMISDTSRAMKASPQYETLTIRSGISFTERWLLPRLPLFLAEYPYIDLVIDTRSEFGSPGVDLEIRYGHPKASGLHVEALRQEVIQPLCSPALLRGPNAVRDIRDLTNHTLIESKRSIVTWAMWLSAQKGTIGNGRQLLFDSTILALQAAVYGLGVALEGDFLANDELASGRLVTPFHLRQMAIKAPLRFLVIPNAKRNLKTVRSFREWMIREINAD